MSEFTLNKVFEAELTATISRDTKTYTEHGLVVRIGMRFVQE